MVCVIGSNFKQVINDRFHERRMGQSLVTLLEMSNHLRLDFGRRIGQPTVPPLAYCSRDHIALHRITTHQCKQQYCILNFDCSIVDGLADNRDRLYAEFLA